MIHVRWLKFLNIQIKMSSSRIQNKPRYKTAPRNSSPSRDPKLLLIKQRINQIASNMRSPLKPSNSSILSDTCKETRIRTPSQKRAEDLLEEFLVSNGFEQYLECFQENQLSYADLPFLTKDDLIDMRIPIGPRNRLIKLIETIPEAGSNFEPSPKRNGLRDEVDRFMSELSQFSKRSEQRFRHSSREQSLEASFESENSSKVCENILVMLKDISEKQSFMMKAIEENQKAIVMIRQQAMRKRNCDY